MRAFADSAVIEFPQARVRPAAALPEGESAEVMFFTGVRIERLHDLEEEKERLPVARKAGAGDIEFGR